MLLGARPEVVGTVRYYARADGIALDVPHCDPEVLIVHRTRVVAPLPQVAFRGVLTVGVGGEDGLRVAHCERERLLCVWNRHDVDVVGHQAVGPDRATVLRGVLPEDGQVYLVVRVVREDLGAAVAALRHMVRDSG